MPREYDVMTLKLYDRDMAKERLTVYLEPEVARALRVAAARRGMKDSDVVEEALRDKLLFTALLRSAALNTDLTPDEALELAVRVQHESRQARKARKAS
jgi:hypothetical protein